jgi:hypothetical protein
MEFWSVEKDVVELSESLIGKYHAHLSTARIVIMYRDKASAAELESNQICVAKKVSGVYATLTEKDFLILVTYPLWIELSEEQKQAALDVALTSCNIKLDENDEPKLDDTGNPIWQIKPFNLICHGECVKRWDINMFEKISECIKDTLAKDKDGADTSVEVDNESGGTTKAGKRLL